MRVPATLGGMHVANLSKNIRRAGRFAVAAACLSGVIAGPAAASPGCPGDIDQNQAVDVDDLFAVIDAWGDHAVTRVIHVTNFEFTPSAIEVRRGDVIQWTLDLGLHTITSGTLCSADGRFDEAINAVHPSFQYVLQVSDVGTVGYFCNPHCGQNMTGTIEVADFPEDVTGDGMVDVDDLFAVINAWGPCS